MNFFAKPERLCTGYRFLEGPVWVDAGSSLLEPMGATPGGLIFSDILASRQYWWADGRTGIFREPTGQANGNALDRDGTLLSCEHENRCISRIDGARVTSTVVDRYAGKRLNSPNDVVARSDGTIFFTDPPYGVTEDQRELEFQGVYSVAPGSSDPVLQNDAFRKPNGLAFSVDEASLYIADTENGHLRRFSVGVDGTLSNEITFCECERPDGMCIDSEDNVWVACMEGVEIFDAHGQRIGFIALPERPANVAFGDAQRGTLYVCARTSIYTVETEIAGQVRRDARRAAEVPGA